MNNVPKDPAVLLSFINTQLRDFYPTLLELCQSLQINQEELERSLSVIDYHYNEESNQFK